MKNIIITTAITCLICMNLRAQISHGPSFNGTLTTELPASVFKGQWLKLNYAVDNTDDRSDLLLELLPEDGKAVTLYSRILNESSDAGYLIVTIPSDLPATGVYVMRLILRSADGKESSLSAPVQLKDMFTWYLDADGDGLGDPTRSFVSAHASEPGCVLNNLDGDDSIAATRPGEQASR